MFLASLHVYAAVKAQQITSPYCSLFQWLDCEGVLNSRYAVVFGVPVAMLGVVAYGVLLGCLWRVQGPRSNVQGPEPQDASRPGAPGQADFLLRTLTAILGLSALWFLYVQAAVLKAWCLWCLAEHAVGLALFGMVWMTGPRSKVHSPRSETASRPGAPGQVANPFWPLGLAALCVAALIAGQHLGTHSHAVKVKGVELDPAQHPVLGVGNTGETPVPLVIEVVDYTCPRCARLAAVIREYRKRAQGPAFVVLTVPLHPGCNAYHAADFGDQVEEQHRHACELAELAHALWLVRPEGFAGFHDWLFEHQGELRVDAGPARQEAVRIAGEEGLSAALERVRAEGRVARDVEISVKIGVTQLPGLIAGSVQIREIPEDAGELQRWLEDAFR